MFYHKFGRLVFTDNEVPLNAYTSVKYNKPFDVMMYLWLGIVETRLNNLEGAGSKY